MYSELIFTRCGRGIDILKGGATIENAGFKVFACSNDILKDDVVDLRLLQNAAQRKEYFSDPNFMDDAYHFLTPDFGGKIFVNFHPRRFDKNATGDYAHRPGNFVNQIFVGPFGNCYPYEFFGDESLWDAQKRNEAFYYENAPAPLKGRDSLTPTEGWITVDDIERFVAGGRRDALKKAIAFILVQYSLPQKKRKYLVVKDVSSKNIELWIAAIERAFSPRMASGLSFTTRLDDFVNSNQYAVNPDGKYQAQIDYQNPDQKTRYRAMIVGIDERNQDDAAAARPAPHLPFVVLDGKCKTISFDADVSHQYFDTATDYKSGASFCQKFLQLVNLSAPSLDVLKLYEAFDDIQRYRKAPQSNLYVNAIDILSRFKFLKSPQSEGLYSFVKQEFAKNLDAEATYSVVLPWLERFSAVVGDGSAATVRENLKKVVCSTFVESIFTRPSDNKTDGVYRGVSQSPFAQDAARLLSSREIVSKYDVSSFMAKDWLSFNEKFIASVKDGDDVSLETLAGFLRQSVKMFYKEKDEQRAANVVALHANVNSDSTVRVLLEEAKKAKNNDDQALFFLRQASRILLRTISSADDLNRFYASLQSYGLDSHIGGCLVYKAEMLSSPQEMETILRWTLDNVLHDVDVAPILRVLDNNLKLSEKENVGLARLIQDSRPDDLVCKNSAHICALTILEDSPSSTTELTTELRKISSQGVPLIEDKVYADLLLKRLFRPGLSYIAFKIVVESAATSEFYTSLIVNSAVKRLETRDKKVAGKLVRATAEIRSETLDNELVKALSELKNFRKGMKKIGSMLIKESDNKVQCQIYFTKIKTGAENIRNQNKSPSFLARLFSRSK